MLRLSQRAINNVVIFAMLIAIALFNFDLFLPRHQALPNDLTLIPQEAHILKIVFTDFSVERVGETFVLKSRNQRNLDPVDIVRSWQNMPVVPIVAPELGNYKSTKATLWMAGEQNGHTFTFYSISNNQVALNYEERWFSVSAIAAEQLLGEWE